MGSIEMKISRLLVLFSVLLASALYTWHYQPATAENTMEGLEEMTRDISGWTFLRDIPMDYRQYTALDPNSLIFRDYRNANHDVVNLAVVYHQNDRWGAHDPTVCYRSQGWDVSPLNESAIVNVGERKIELNGFTSAKANYQSLVYYFWFSSRDKLVGSRTHQMADMVVSGLVRGYTESGFVRFSIDFNPYEDDLDRKSKVLKDFAGAFVRVLQAGG